MFQVFVSPRQRAQKTFHTLFDGYDLPPHETTDAVAEWNYGDYEGLLISEIKKKDPLWSIWLDGCPGGETPSQIKKRIDDMIVKVSLWRSSYYLTRIKSCQVQEYHRNYKEEGIGKRDSKTFMTARGTSLK